MQRGTDVTNLSDKDSWGKEGWGFWRKKSPNKRMWESHFLGFSNTVDLRLHKPQWNFVDNHRLLGKKKRAKHFLHC